MAYKLQLKRGVLASLPNGSVGEPLFTTDTFDLYVGKGDGTNVKLQKFIASGSSSQFLKGDGSLDSNTYQGVLSGSGIVKSTGGTISYLTDNSANWDSAYNDKINSASVSGTTTKTLTLTQQDGGTITASWSDYDTAPVTSVFGRTGVVVAASGDYTTSLVTEGTNLYFTDARARAAITLTTTGSSGSATYVGGTLNVPTYTLAGLGGVPTSRSLTINGTSYDLSADRSWSVGTVTSVDLSVPTGFAISGNPITSSGTLALAFATGYSLPTTASQTNWDAAYNDKINSASVTGTTTKTLTLNQQDGGTITASWTDINTDAVTSVFGRTGAVVAASGDYTTTQVTEGTNLYYTEARVSANTDVAANTAARHSAVTIGTANGLSLSTQQLSLGLASGSTTGALSSTDWTTFNSKQAALNGTGFVKISGTTISYDNSTYYLASNPSSYIAKTDLSAVTPLSYDNVTGVFQMTQANSTTSGYITSTDWNTFNNKQSALTNPVTGTGTTNYLPKWTSGSALGNSVIQESSSSIGINVTPTRVLHLSSSGTSSAIRLDNTVSGRPFLLTYDDSQNLTFINSSDTGYTAFNSGTGASSTKVIITNAGNVGIGTTSPAQQLHLTGYLLLENNQIIRWKNASGAERNIFVLDTNNQLQIGGSIDAIRFLTNDSSERMRLTSGGNLLVGTTTDSGYKLDVSGTGRFTNTLQLDKAGGLAFRAYYGSGNNRSLDINIDGSNGDAQLTWNTTYNGGWKYYLNNYAAKIASGDGLILSVAATGTAGNTISWINALTLASTGAATFSSSVTVNSSFNGLGFGSFGRSVDGSYRLIVQGQGTSSSTYGLSVTDSGGNQNLWVRDDGVTYLRGNVGIGTTSPQVKLDLQNGNVGFYNNTASSGGAQLYLGDMNFAGGAYATSAPGIGAVFSSATSVAGDLAFYTYGGVANSRNEVMRIRSGNVGIGTTSPASLLDVNGAINTSTGFVLNNPTTGSAGLTIQYQGTTYAYARAEGGSGEFRYYIGPSAGWGGYHTFYTDNSERMRITSGGNLLVGTTTNSGERLVVSGNAKIGGGGNPALSITGTDGAYTGLLYINAAGGGASKIFANGGANTLYLGTNNVERLTIDNTGAATFSSSVTATQGIFGQTGSGSFGVHISNNDQSNVRLRLTNTGSGGQAFSIVGGNPGASNAGFAIYDETNAATRLYISSTGAATFSSSVTAGGILYSRQANYPQIVFQETTSSTDALIFYDNVAATKNMGFRVNSGSNVMTLTSSNVGIGTTSPSDKLHVSGSGNTAIFVTGSGNTTYLQSVTSETRLGNLSSGGGAIVFQPADVERMRITSGGNVGIGTTNPTEKLHVNGNIKTAAPTGYTAGSWKLGTANTGTVTANRYITIEIDGQIYTINALLGTP